MNIQEDLDSRLDINGYSVPRHVREYIGQWAETLVATRDLEIEGLKYQLQAAVERLQREQAGACIRCGGYPPGHGMVTSGADICTCGGAH